MIKINLATKKQATGVEGAKAGGGGLGSSKFDAAFLKEPAVRKLIIAILVAFLASWYQDSVKEERLLAVRASIQKLQSEQVKLEAEAGKMKEAEQLKAVLETDRTTIKTKLEVMTTLLENRDAPSKMLRVFSESMPQDTWLSQVRVSDNVLTVSGYSIDFSSVSTLTKSLAESAYFSEVNPKSSQRTTDEAGNSIAKFEITGRRR